MVIDSSLFAKQSRTIRAGQPFSLEVNVTQGTGPFSFQWYRKVGSAEVALTDGFSGNQIINGALTARILVAPYDSTAAVFGDYRVVVSSGSSSKSPDTAVTISKMQPPPSGLAVQPSAVGPYSLKQSPLLSISGLSSTTDYRFQWRRNGRPLTGGSLSTYSPTISKDDLDANYDVVVSNDAGSSVATALNIQLTDKPVLLRTPLQPLTVLAGQPLVWSSFSFSGTATQTQWTRAAAAGGARTPSLPGMPHSQFMRSRLPSGSFLGLA